MDNFLNDLIWRQFGAAIDMLENTLHACPDSLWDEHLWHDPDGPEYGKVWVIFSHTLYYLDRYLSGNDPDFAAPPPFTRDATKIDGVLPHQPYTRAELQGYLDHCRAKCEATLTAMTGERARERQVFRWMEPSFAELQLYNMRHVQEHTAQISLLIGRSGAEAPDWVSRVGEGT